MYNTNMKLKMFLTWIGCLCIVAVLTISATNLFAISKSSKRAIKIYTSFLNREVSMGGNTDLPQKRSTNTNGYDADYSRFLQNILGNSQYGQKIAYGNTSNDLFAASGTVWNLQYKRNPYIDYDTITSKVGNEYQVYFLDSHENTLKYQHDTKSYSNKAVRKIKKDFSKAYKKYAKSKKKMKDTDKFAFIANYVCEKLTYANGIVYYKNKEMFAGGDLYTAAYTGKGCCTEYANMVNILCKQLGIECRVVRGYVAGNGGSTNLCSHQWNIVKLGGVWMWVDITSDDDGKTIGCKSNYYCSGNINNLFSRIFGIIIY